MSEVEYDIEGMTKALLADNPNLREDEARDEVLWLISQYKKGFRAYSRAATRRAQERRRNRGTVKL